MPNLPEYIALSSEIQLEKIAPAHAPSLFAHIHRHRDYFSRFMHWPRFTHQLQDSQAFVQLCQQEAEQGLSFVWAICVSGEAVGTISLNKPIDWQNRTALIGYWLSPDKQGRGIITHAVNTLIQATQSHFSTYILRCAVHNDASNKVALRAGFRFIRTVENAEQIGDICYAQHIYHHTLDSEERVNP